MRLERLKSFVEEDLQGFQGYSGKRPTLKLLRQLQDESNFKTDAKIMSILKAFDSSIQFNSGAVQDLAETSYNNLRKEDLGGAGAGAGGGGASLSGMPKSKPAPKLKQPTKSKPPSKAKSAYNPQSVPKMKTNKPAKPKPKPKPKPQSSEGGSGAGAGAGAPSQPKPKKPRKPMSQAHKDKIKAGIKKYHANCKKGMVLLAKQKYN